LLPKQRVNTTRSSAVNPVSNSLNLFKTQTPQAKENSQAEKLEPLSETEGDPVEKKEIEKQASVESHIKSGGIVREEKIYLVF